MLSVEIKRVFDENFQVYGVRKVWRQLLREGYDVDRRTVARLMKKMALQGVIRGRRVRTTVSDKARPCPLDHVNRRFRAPRPNALWVSDFTYVATWTGFVYVAFVIDAFASPEFRGTKPNTQRNYRGVLEPLAKRIGHTAVRHIERRHVKAMRDERSETPGMANLTVKIVSALLRYAVDNDWIDHNPATRVKLFKLGEHRAWTADECLQFEARWALGTMQRRCYVLGKCTGQRAGDLAKMTRAHRRDGFIFVKQEKTGTELEIPELQALTAELARGEQGHMSLLTEPARSGFDGNRLGKWVADAIDAAGPPDDCVLHGLRKLTVKMLAEAGNSPHLIGAITGHSPQSPEILRYTRQADQRKMANGGDLEPGAERQENADCQTHPRQNCQTERGALIFLWNSVHRK